MTEDDAAALLRRMMTAAIAAADPATVLAAHLPREANRPLHRRGGG